MGVMKTTMLMIATMIMSGCLSTTSAVKTTQAEAESINTQLPVEEQLLLAAIPEPFVPKGACGMVLWSAEGDRPSPVFRYVSEKTAEVNLNGRLVRLSRTTFNGATGFGVFEAQDFESEDGISASVTVRFAQGFDGGAYLERALITLESSEGWRSVVPAAGLAGCR